MTRMKLADMNTLRRGTTKGIGLLALLFAATCLLGQKNAKTASNNGAAADAVAEVVELPTYEVRGRMILPPPESWRYVRVPDVEVVINGRPIPVQGFEVLSNLSVKNTGLFVHELQLRQVASAYFWPSLAVARTGQPPVIVIDRTDDPMLSSKDWPLIEWDGIDAERAGDVVQSTFSGFDETDDWTLWDGASVPFWTDASAMGGPMFDRDNQNRGTGIVDARWRDPGRALAMRNSSFGSSDTRARPLPKGTVETRTVDGMTAIRVRAGNRHAFEERVAGEVNASLLALSLERMSPPPPMWLQTGLRWLISTMEVSRLK